ncbi:DUF2157 domain-containing protein [Sphingobacterium sp. HJSM2_6]|uniref:DUF2157 domain-containing protein n=1 Tax=Sphingobacterium sp. HJSM2_6 TaxID=3366264 RepID=UPI003BE20974
MKKIRNKDFRILAKHSNINASDLGVLLKSYCYPDRNSWIKTLQLSSLILALGFMILGIVFFFAFNWDYMHKFSKLGIIQLLLLGGVGFIFLPKIPALYKKIALLLCSVLVGVLFAVFGQIYQTGANAYDFFLAWTILVSLWVFSSSFSPTWILYFALINISIFLFRDQVMRDWNLPSVLSLLFLINILPVFICIYLNDFKKSSKIPLYFIQILSLAAFSFSTFGIAYGIFVFENNGLSFLIGSAIIIYSLLFWYGFKFKRSFFLALVPFSLIVIGSNLLFKISDEWSMLLLITAFISISTILLIRFISKFIKNTHEQSI